jgi:multiple sugar transport system permease protein
MRRWLRKAGFWLSVMVIVSPAILVFLWMLSLSLKNEIDNLAYPPVFIPSPPTFDNFLQVFEQNSIGRYLWNSIVVSGGATLVALLIGVPAGFGIARVGARRLTVLILIARMTPALSFLIPLFAVFQFLRLNNTLTALVITHLVITVPIVVYIMAGYFETLPKELEESGVDRRRQRVEDVSVRRAARSARPGIVVGTILAFIFSWNNFVFGAVLAGRETRTLPVAVYNVLTFEQLAWGPLAAAAIIVTLPVLLLTIVIPEGNRRRPDARRRQGRLIATCREGKRAERHSSAALSDLLHALAGMGHGDEIGIVDANFPAASLGARLIELRGASSPDALDAILTVFPLDTHRRAGRAHDGGRRRSGRCARAGDGLRGGLHPAWSRRLRNRARSSGMRSTTAQNARSHSCARGKCGPTATFCSSRVSSTATSRFAGAFRRDDRRLRLGQPRPCRASRATSTPRRDDHRRIFCDAAGWQRRQSSTGRAPCRRRGGHGRRGRHRLVRR